MLNYNSVIKNEMKQESISVKEISPVIKINLRGKKREFLTNIGKKLNIPQLNVNLGEQMLETQIKLIQNI